MHNNQIKCTFGCLRDENQQTIFEECIPLKQNLHIKGGVKVADIYGDIKLQKAAIMEFIQIEENRLVLKKNWKKYLVHIYIISLICYKICIIKALGSQEGDKEHK